MTGSQAWVRLAQRVRSPRRALGDAYAAVEPLSLSLRLLVSRQPSPPMALAMVYRARNVDHVRALLSQAGGQLTVALWALDEVVDDLAPLTVGQGPGGRLDLLNRAASKLQLPHDAWLLFADDDVTLSAGSLADAVRLAVLAGFDVAQPSYGRGSPSSWTVNRHRRMSWARRTRFVETGPLLMFSPRARSACLPFATDLGMGWGSEAIWGTQLQLGSGVLDGVTMVHHEPMGGNYNTVAMQQQADEVFGRLLPQAGFASLEEFQAVTGRWPLWRHRPSWSPQPELGRAAV